MAEIYQHLLTCTRRANTVDEINQEITDIWATLMVNNPAPVLNGSSPKVSLQQIAVFLLSSDSFRLRYADDPKKWKAFKLFIDEARSALFNQIKSHPMIQQVRDRASVLQGVDPFEVVDDDNDEDQHDDDNNEDGGER